MTQTSPASSPSDAGVAAPTFLLPPLPYGIGELSPVLSVETLEIHHGRHHARYVEILNRLLHEQNFSARTLEEIVRIADGSGAKGLFNNAAQAWNHGFFWESMTPAVTLPTNALADAIVAAFGDVESLRSRFLAEGTGHFGSGWVWLIARGRKLEVSSTHDAACLLTDEGTIPLLTCDVWEHAYYIDFRNARPKFVETFLNHLVNWSFAQANFA